VLVTNALQYLPQADLVVVMEAGRVKDVGTYAALRALGTDFDALMATHSIGGGADEGKPAGSRRSLDGRPAAEATAAAKKEGAVKAEGAKVASDNLTGTEKRESGKVTLAVYYYYAKAMGGLGVVALVMPLSLLCPSLAAHVSKKRL
jgi:hypothetical protein